jgi:hypothetical protein
MTVRSFCLAMSTCLLLAGADREPKTLQVKEARRLVYESLSEETKRLPGVGLDPGRVENGRCMTFDVLWANPGIGSAHVAFYTVDLRTGALWTGVTGVLKLVSIPAVTRLQRDLRKSVGISETEYRKAVEKHPCGY